MARDPHIPLFLWVATAALVHLAGGGGANQAAHVLSERLDVQRFAQAVRAHVRAKAKPIEVALLNEAPPDPPAKEPDVSSEDPEVADQVQPEEPSDESIVTEPSKTPAEKLKEAEEKKKEPEPEKVPEKPEPPEEKKKETAEEKKKEDLPAVQVKNRIAVQQFVEDQNQQDNPEAEFIGDHANRVKEQTQARITSTDQNDPNPTPGNAHVGPTAAPGNAHVSDVAHSEDVEGDPDKAPSQQAAAQEKKATYQPPSSESKGGGDPNADARDAKLQQSAGQREGTANGEPKSAGPAQEQRDAVAASRAVDAVDEVHTSPEGTFEMGRAREAQAAQQGRASQKRRLPARKGDKNPLNLLGLGASGRSRGGLNLNLSQEQAVATVGQDQLARERLADGERRRSKHRGSWKTLGIERWRAAIENYNSSVKPGNQTALNTARVPFASYLNTIHSRLHPIFADNFLASLDDLPREHPLSRPDLKTNLEIVLDQSEGRVVKMGVTRSSGSTVFDIAALESVQSASPYGKAPTIIASNDGNVYLHWEFHRNPYYACSTYFARPYIIDVKQQPAPPSIPIPSVPPFRPTEEPVDREGHLLQPVFPELGAPSRHAAR